MFCPLVFECSFLFQNQRIYKSSHSFYHDDERVAILIHTFNVSAAEIAAVQNKSYFLYAYPAALFSMKSSCDTSLMLSEYSL